MKDSHPHLGGFRLLKTAPGTCPECAVTHDPAMPHNAQSLTYQYDFYGKHGVWPTWGNAMAHCTQEVRDAWSLALQHKGVPAEKLIPAVPLAPGETAQGPHVEIVIET